MDELMDRRLLAVVAQEQFEVNLNQFCKLVPVMYADGEMAKPADFPNDGEIWWMLSQTTKHVAEPGRLVACHIENARDFDASDPSKSQYQARKESVRDLKLDEDGIQIIEIPAAAIETIQDLVSGGFRMDSDRSVPPIVMLRWRGGLYWPFRATVGRDRQTGSGQVSFVPANTDMYIYKVDESGARQTGQIRRVSTRISLTKSARSDTGSPATVDHEIILANGVEKLLGQEISRLHLEPLDQKLVRLAKHCTTRKKRKQLRDLLDEIGMSGQDTEVAPEIGEAIERTKELTEQEDLALDRVVKALMESGLLGEDRLTRVEAEYAKRYIEDRRAQLEATAEAGVAATRSELRDLEERLEGIRATIQQEEAGRRVEFEATLKAEKTRMLGDVEKEKQAVAREKKELDRQTDLLEGNLEKVTAELRDAGDEVVNRYLAIAPLLGAVGLQQPVAQVEQSKPNRSDNRPPEFEIPEFVTSASGRSEVLLDEEEFFERFTGLVESSGFSYWRSDLKRFHLSMKTGQLTVIGGPSGIGKSSLPMLYSRALLGDQHTACRPAALMVNVSPSWIDGRDLLGHVNTFEGRFYPSETGLFRKLVHAHEEFATFGDRSGIHLACIDEMNLSQVEHYFSDFMLVLERANTDRHISCFAQEAVRADDPLRRWHRVNLPRSLRFVGTVNFDETTRLLSDRFLDRIDLIQLRPAPLPRSAGYANDGAASASGPMVTLRDYRKWVRRDSSLPPTLGATLDDLRPLLLGLGSPLSPRTYRGICRFVGSAEPVMSAEEAFDTQLAQRVIPRLRNIYTSRQVDALDALISAMENSSVCTFEESLRLLEVVREQAGRRGLSFGD